MSAAPDPERPAEIESGKPSAPSQPLGIRPGAMQIDDGTWISGADVEIWEQCTRPQAVLKPSRIRINGTEILCADKPYVIGKLSKCHTATITVTMFINTLKIYGVQPEAD